MHQTSRVLQAPRVLDLDTLEAAVALSDGQGHVLAATHEAATLLGRVAEMESLPGPLPADLWSDLEQAPVGEAVEWRSPSDTQQVLGCTRYRFGEQYVLLMKEVSDKRAEFSRRLHRQRLEATGRLVASVAHELRNSVASIVYSADFLGMAGADAPSDARSETIAEMLEASHQLRTTVDGLLGYARVGPDVCVPVSLRDVLTRAQGFLRSVYKPGKASLIEQINPDADSVLGNTLTVEQVFVNLLLNAAEACPGKELAIVRVMADRVQPVGLSASEQEYVRIRFWDNGCGIPKRLHASIFEPFFSTRGESTGLGLTIAIEAVQSLGGTIKLEEVPTGACFAVFLPHAEGTK